MTAAPGSRAYRVAKRAADLIGATFLGILLLPLIAVVAVLVKLECPSAPVLFRQRRAGRAGREFELLKFRSMVPNAHEMREQLRERSAVAWPDFSLKDDPRVTRLGRILRRTSIDELPQLWNVIRGEMSLVGPRPTSFGPETYDLWQTERLEFTPGITGPWQVAGRGTMEFADRCRIEISFFREPSLLRELGLLLRTVAVVFRRTGVA